LFWACLRFLTIILCCAVSAPASFSAPTVVDSASSLAVNNGLVSFNVTKSNGVLKGLTLNGQSLMSHGSSQGYFSANVGDIGVSGSTYWQMGAAGTTFSYNVGSDFVDIALHYPATSTMPMNVTQHYVLRDGETGFHVYADVEHTTSMANKRIEEMRFVLRADPTTFTHHYVSEDRHDIMPTPADLVNRIQSVQDATDLLQPGTAYEAETGKNIYTKYDYSERYDRLESYGFYGSQYGAWIVQPNRETLLGGPTKQELTVHQTTTTPVLLGMLVGQHYGTPGSVETVGNYNRSLGPMYVHLNSGANPTDMAADANSYFDPEYHRAFYDTLGAPGWVTSDNRGTVNGLLQMSSGLPAGAKIVLADNNTDFQFSKQGYQYEGQVAADGSFSLPHVRPGNYRLTAYQYGTFGEMTMNNVQVTAGNALDLGTLNWSVPDHGSDVWQIGEFDRSAMEFKRGADNEFRAYGMWEKYAADFPSDVDFVIGQSDEATDWNYAHWERVPAGHSPTWNIMFERGGIPANTPMTLTVAVAGNQDANLRVRVNGTIVANNWDVPYSSSILSRSGMEGAFSSIEISFNSNLLINGTNTISLAHASPGSALNQGIVYDALRLEVDALLGDFNNDGQVNGRDFLFWQRGQSPSPFSSQDLAHWQQNYGKNEADFLTAAVTVPEPAAWLMLGAIGAVQIGMSRRR
jgi:rhamnogalacturonan endolyase